MSLPNIIQQINSKLPLSGGKMTGSINRDGTSVSWRTILDNSPQSSFLYQNTYTGYMPALNLKTKDGRVGIGTYENYLALTYFLDTNTTNGADTQLNLHSNGTATIGNKPIVCVTYYRSGANWYRKYSDGFIEQGGDFSNSARGTTITFPLAFTSTNYQALACINHADNGWTATTTACVRARTTSNMVVQIYHNSSNTTGLNSWYACGY